MFLKDFNKAYLQSKEKLQRDAFIQRCAEFELKSFNLLKLENLLFGSSEMETIETARSEHTYQRPEHENICFRSSWFL